jgi:hypothetical protein
MRVLGELTSWLGIGYEIRIQIYRGIPKRSEMRLQTKFVCEAA